VEVALREKNEKLRMDNVIQINKKYQSTFESSMKKAKINSKDVQNHAQKLMKKYSTKDKKYFIKPGDYLTWGAWVESATQQAPPQETELNFAAPFDFTHSAKNGPGSVRSDLETGSFSANANAFLAQSFQNIAGLGLFIRIPWATQRVRISARMPGVSGLLTAAAALGGSGAKAFSVIDVLTEDNEQCVTSFEHAIAIAPVVWISQVTFNDTSVMACEMRAPSANQDIAVRFQSGVEVTAGGPASTIGSIRSTPESIRARLIE
jgi:hypothetical protein